MDEQDHRFEEWRVTRELVDKFEDRIYDLRKYGFSFITALLTAQAILVNSTTVVQSQTIQTKLRLQYLQLLLC